MKMKTKKGMPQQMYMTGGGRVLNTAGTRRKVGEARASRQQLGLALRSVVPAHRC